MTPTITRWDGCYRDAWQDLIVAEAFAHPAKYARGLIHRIYRHLLERGYVRPGQTVLDPFAGVGLGALDAMTYGLGYVGVELESRFVDLAQQNLALWRRRYGFTGGTVVQGDSRQLRQVLEGAQAGCVVGSPPFQDCHANGIGVEAHSRQVTFERVQSRIGYGHSPGQLGALPPGTPPSCVVSSPPWIDQQHFHDPAFVKEDRRAGRQGTQWEKYQVGQVNSGQPYGDSAGQLGALPPGTPPAAVVSSPPWGEVEPAHDTAFFQAHRKTMGRNPTAPGGTPGHYGTTPGQLGALSPDAVIASPPYAGTGQVLGTHNGIDYSKVQGSGKAATPARVASGEGYGHSAGQLGAMPAGAIVSSPPYEGTISGSAHGIDWSKAGAATGNRKRGEGTQHEATLRAQLNYGGGNDQLGNTTGDTFWSAADAVMREVAALLPVGAVACWVVKDYISKSKRVPFCDQWRQLCESHGLVLIEEIHASLIEESGVQETLFGEAEAITVKRCSFFRRLYEKREGAVRIDHESVLIMRRET